MNYADITPITAAVPADRQGAKRHYGVHPYFTRRPFNVVRKYILHFSQEGDRILDPFGGSGVTAIEAFLENRVGIHNDINPLANFIARGIADLWQGGIGDFRDSLQYLERRCKSVLRELQVADTEKVKRIGQQVNLPTDVKLPKNSDVESYFELFSRKQLLSLCVLKDAIDGVENVHPRKGMLLAWSATLSKLNKTFLSAEGRAESRGGSSIFSIYRYKVAKEPVELPPWETFYERANNIINAKIEIERLIQLKQQTGGWQGEYREYAEDVGRLSKRLADSVDYIFTDPPYGGHISYLDLSTLWNAWLGILPEREIKEKEIIVGGEMEFSESQYLNRLHEAIEACVRMLKADRWFSVVFQHWNTKYFEAILTSATDSGAELKAAVSQIGDPIWSMHKKKNKNSVLAGELILTFYKSGKRKQIKKNGHFEVAQAIDKILAHTQGTRIFGEYLFNKVVIEAWNQAAIHSLNISKNEFASLLEQRGWFYDQTNHYWVKNSHQPDALFDGLQ